jgi:hypothetical protein
MGKTRAKKLEKNARAKKSKNKLTPKILELLTLLALARQDADFKKLLICSSAKISWH